MLTDYQINKEFRTLYNSLTSDLTKTSREHYLNVKQLKNGIKLGIIRIQRDHNGYVLRDTSIPRNNILYKNIVNGEIAILLAVFTQKKKEFEIDNLLSLDHRYDNAKIEYEFLQLQEERFAKADNYIIADICLSKMDIAKQKLVDLTKEIHTAYVVYVF